MLGESLRILSSIHTSRTFKTKHHYRLETQMRRMLFSLISVQVLNFNLLDQLLTIVRTAQRKQDSSHCVSLWQHFRGFPYIEDMAGIQCVRAKQTENVEREYEGGVRKERFFKHDQLLSETHPVTFSSSPNQLIKSLKEMILMFSLPPSFLNIKSPKHYDCLKRLKKKI